MFNRIIIFTKDTNWEYILTSLNAKVVKDHSEKADINLDLLNIKKPILIQDLKSLILSSISLNNDKILQQLNIDKNSKLSEVQKKIIIILFKNKKISIIELKDILGIAENAKTRCIENAIRQIKKNLNIDIIKNKNGEYFINGI